MAPVALKLTPCNPHALQQCVTGRDFASGRFDGTVVFEE
jgi:hypothetical protein